MTATAHTPRRVVDALLELSVVGSFTRIGFRLRSRMAGFTDPLAGGMAGKRVIVTGANSGLGFAITVALLQAGATVVATTRSREKSAALRDTVHTLCGEVPASRLVSDEVDLHRLDDVRAFAQRHAAAPLDVLIHNAGALNHRFTLTEDGFEHTVQTHVLAPFVLTSVLRDALISSGHGRVITVTSGGLYMARLRDDLFTTDATSFRGTTTYAAAKRAQVVLTSQWQRRFGSDALSFYTTHPGWVDTPGLRRSLPGFVRLLRPLLRNTAEGVDTILFLCTSKTASPLHRVWHDRVPRRAHRVPTTFTRRGAAGQLWADTCRLTGIDPYVHDRQ